MLNCDVLFHEQGGLATSDEMCVAEISYYPKVSLAMCQQQGDPYDYLSFVDGLDYGGDEPWLNPTCVGKFSYFPFSFEITININADKRT